MKNYKIGDLVQCIIGPNREVGVVTKWRKWKGRMYYEVKTASGNEWDTGDPDVFITDFVSGCHQGHEECRFVLAYYNKELKKLDVMKQEILERATQRVPDLPVINTETIVLKSTKSTRETLEDVLK